MLRLMHVHAHPDDESSKGAASTAKYVAEGVDVHVVTCTGGERGSILNPRWTAPTCWRTSPRSAARRWSAARADPRRPPGLAGLRGLRLARGRPEAAAARGLLRAGPGRGGRRAAGPADPQLPAARDDDVRRERRLPAPRPRDVPQGQRGGLRGGRRPGRATPTPGSRGSRSSSTTTTPSTARAPSRCTTRCSPRGLESPYAERLEEWKPDPAHDARITTRVPCAEYFPVRDRALLAHATQIDPDGRLVRRARWSVHQKAWPTEDYELVRSHGRERAARGRPVRRRPRARAETLDA